MLVGAQDKLAVADEAFAAFQQRAGAQAVRVARLRHFDA